MKIELSSRHMPHPVLKLSLEEIRQESFEWIDFLQSTSVDHPDLSWVSPQLDLAREFQTLATEHSLDAVRIHDFILRLKHHIVSDRIKGVDSVVWAAEALERLALRKPDD